VAIKFGLANSPARIRQPAFFPADPAAAGIEVAVAPALGLPDFSGLRRLLAQEPVVFLHRL